ncbi:hypothetical protein PRECH8_02700 [Insulibacter thermoxylanivorax]|uniref:Uncharacterized protein n=1 Tax=Insulibacter thermoxylanivorax TaxID=2749268 RepID=A0A916QCE0_9BACL|nr:hypothetical protein PRECH8_02700 [Insulibacter thermoxylanivorax]
MNHDEMLFTRQYVSGEQRVSRQILLSFNAIPCLILRTTVSIRDLHGTSICHTRAVCTKTDIKTGKLVYEDKLSCVRIEVLLKI